MLGRAEIEFLARVFAALVFKPRHVPRKIVRELGEKGRRNGDAGALHLGEHRDQRPLQHFINIRAPFGDESRFQQQMQAKRDVGAFGHVARGFFDRCLFKGNFLPASAGNIGKRGRFVRQMNLRQLFQPMPVQSKVERVGQQHAIIERAYAKPPLGEQHDQIFQIVPDLQNALVFKQRRETRERVLFLQLRRRRACKRKPAIGAVRERNVAARPRLNRQRDAD